ncbi:MAG: RNA 2',3'-cyclic phosphodiesterase [Candidatus Hydrogenedentes bacterium]|nr:RNA 2',3'-cyclic phosphodiesterase [Candidatus Hydrogenedentota bacterium]
MRTFIAIELPDTARQALAKLSRRLQACPMRASWAKPENMHLTLRFLGDIEEPDVDTIREILAAAYAGAESFDLDVRGTGVFPNASKPSVVWAGVVPIEGPLKRVQAAAEEAACAIGLKPERRRFHPHVTLARIKEPARSGSLAALLVREQAFDGGSFSVGSVSLFSSRLDAGGAVHTRLQEFAF